MADLIAYNDGELELSVSVNEETVWLTQKQIAELFEVTVPNINMHIKAIYKEKELFENRTIQKYLIVQQEGKREVKREIESILKNWLINLAGKISPESLKHYLKKCWK